MQWCVAEAMKSVDQKMLGSAESISLFRDERQGRIAIRFRAVTANLQVHSGTLGQERDAGTGARNITLATLKVMQRACSRFANPPAASKMRSFVKKDLLQHVRQTVTSIAVDSASDEVVSAELMRTAVVSPALCHLTPQLKFVLRDKAHASRRITSSPWKADSALTQTLKLFATGRGSIARLIQNSHELRRVFAEFAQTCHNAIRRAVVNMRAAGHRFESHARPLGRTCLFLHAAISAALHMVQTRSDASAGFAKMWLQSLNEEQALQAAMLADAADSSLALTRVLDSEHMDPCTLSENIALYLQSIKGLFNDKKVLTSFGYTSTMLQTLRRPVVFQVGQVTRALGSEAGVKQDIQDKCLRRMQAWVKLAESAIRAEFPSHEIAQAGLQSWTAVLKASRSKLKFTIITK